MNPRTLCPRYGADETEIGWDHPASAPSGRTIRSPSIRSPQLSLVLMFLTDFVYTKKYNAVSRQLGYAPAEKHVPERGFVIIQIDALAHEQLAEAMELGYAPNMKRLIQRRGFKFHSWRCGLPSSTPSVQAKSCWGKLRYSCLSLVRQDYQP